MGDLARAARLLDDLGEIVCITLIKGVDEANALRRLGGYPDTIREIEPDEVDALVEAGDDCPQLGLAVGLGSWSAVVEPLGFCGADHLLLEAASIGCEAISVLRHDYASSAFAYAVDGTLVSGFDPDYPDPASMHGSDPQRLWPAMRAVGFRPPDEIDEQTWSGATAMALLLAEQMSGVTVPAGPLSQPRLYAQLEPWFAVPADPGDLLSVDQFTLDPQAAPLVAAVEAADPHTQRRVAVEEVRRQAAVIGVADTPGLDDILRAAAEGTATPITADSPLGRHVRTWLYTSRNARASDAGESTHAYALGWFVDALRGVLNPDPRWAALAAVRPLTSSIPGLGDQPLRDHVIRAFHS